MSPDTTPTAIPNIFKYFLLMVMAIVTLAGQQDIKADVAKKSTFKDQTHTKATKCSATALRGHDCHLMAGTNRIHVWKDKIFLNNGFERDFLTLPVSGVEAEWEAIRSICGRGVKRCFVELLIWGLPEEKTDVESLNWLIYEAKDGQIHLQLQKTVQKRKRLSEKKYHYDKMLKYSLTTQGEKTIWTLDREKGDLK